MSRQRLGILLCSAHALRAGDGVLWSPAVAAAPIPETAVALYKIKLP